MISLSSNTAVLKYQCHSKSLMYQFRIYILIIFEEMHIKLCTSYRKKGEKKLTTKSMYARVELKIAL